MVLIKSSPQMLPETLLVSLVSLACRDGLGLVKGLPRTLRPGSNHVLQAI